jgi:ribosomal protein S18 acetylase RimI-like enzyme
MATDAELYYLGQPTRELPVAHPAEFVPVQEFLADESACRALWDFVTTQFRTRSKFLTVWPHVRFVTMIREAGFIKGLLLVTTPVNWQIDYVVVHPDARRQGIAASLVKTALNQAYQRKVPYVMLTSTEYLRPLYEGECNFKVVAQRGP